MRENLLAIADAKHGCRLIQQLGINGGAFWIVYASRTARDNDPFASGKLRSRCIAGPDFRPYSQFPDLPRDQVAILTTRIENGNLRAYFAIRWTMIFLAEFSNA